MKEKKAALDKEIAAVGVKANEQEIAMRKKAGSIGNIVHESVPVSDTEVSRIDFANQGKATDIQNKILSG